VVHIILLADRERLIELVTRSEALPGVSARVADGIDDALTGLSGRGPFFFFIQERLGELSGELIASRLADELKGRSVRFFLLGDPASIGDTFHGGVDESLPDNELAEGVRALVSAPLSETRKRKRPAKKEAADEFPEPSPATIDPVGDSPLPTEDIDDVVEVGRAVFPVEQAPLEQSTSPEDAVPAAGARFHDFLESALEVSAATETPRDEMPEREAHPRAESPAGAIPADTGASSAPEGVRRRLFRQKVWFLLLGGLVGGAFLLSLTLCRAEKPDFQEETTGKGALPLSKETSPASPAPLRSIRTLPSFVPRRSPDAGYGKAHPGWEMYRSTLAEFRVYRESGLILAIQTIDRSGTGLAPGLFSSALTEIAGSPTYVVETAEHKGPYRIEKGRLKNGASILIYRKEPERKVKAFVVDFR
jgi:hypothetical protein